MDNMGIAATDGQGGKVLEEGLLLQPSHDQSLEAAGHGLFALRVVAGDASRKGGGLYSRREAGETKGKDCSEPQNLDR